MMVGEKRLRSFPSHIEGLKIVVYVYPERLGKDINISMQRKKRELLNWSGPDHGACLTHRSCAAIPLTLAEAISADVLLAVDARLAEQEASLKARLDGRTSSAHRPGFAPLDARKGLPLEIFAALLAYLLDIQGLSQPLVQRQVDEALQLLQRNQSRARG